MDNSALWAAGEIAVLVAICAMIIGGLVGFAWGRKTTSQRELIAEEDIMQIFPTSNPLEWDCLPIGNGQKQTL